MSPLSHGLGSLFYLNPELVPEHQDGIQVIGVWMEELLATLHPKSARFLTHLIRSSFLVSVSDKDGTSDYWTRAFHLPMPVSRYLRQPYGNPLTTKELVAPLRGSETISLTYGISSLRLVLSCTVFLWNYDHSVLVATSSLQGFPLTLAYFAIILNSFAVRS